MPVVDVVDGMINLIRANLIAKTSLTVDALTGATTLTVQNSFQFLPGQEIVIVDDGYNDPASPHFNIYEYARVKEAIDTWTVELYDPIVSDWLVSENSFIQKTIGHDPLYTDRVYYGDREVIPTENMAITVEPLSLSNEWIYLMGGLSEEYRVSIMIYGKDIETEEGMKILNKYTDAVYTLFMSDLHPDLTDYYTPIMADVMAGDTSVIIEDTEENREKFPVGVAAYEYENTVNIQDNLNTEQGRLVTNVVPPVSVPGGLMTVSLGFRDWDGSIIPAPFAYDYTRAQFGVLIKKGRYMYDSRIDNIEYGTVQKGSAFIRAARLNWFGKEVEEHRFPQKSFGAPGNEAFFNSSSSSSSSG